jgi:Na+/glutamate symporter
MFVEQAEWYRALCNFGLGNKKTAITQLEAINNKNGYFEKDAKSLLKQLKIK